MTVLGFGWYNYAKLQPSSSPSASSTALASSSSASSSSSVPAPRAEEYRPLSGDERKGANDDDDGVEDAEDDDDKDKGGGSDSETEGLVLPEFGEVLATLPPSLRWLLEGAMELLVRWGLADAFSLTASLASSLPLNLAVYVVSGVFQPLFIMEMSYAGVGHQLGLLCAPRTAHQTRRRHAARSPLTAHRSPARLEAS